MKNNFINILKIISLLYITFVIEIKAEVIAKIEFTSIEINNKKQTDLTDILFSSADSISINYFCDLKNTENSKFLYGYKIKSSTDSFSTVSNQPNKIFYRLKNDEYEFSVWARDSRREWVSDTIYLRFRVNDREAKLLKSISELNSELEFFKNDNKKLIDSLNKQNVAKNDENYSFDWIQIGIAFLAGAIIIGIISAFWKRKAGSDSNKGKGDKKMDQSQELKATLDNLQQENQNLKNELNSLRNQIDALQLRSGDMLKRNKELEESVNKLSSTKDELEKLQEQKDELFAMLIHDIKNPAGIIKSLVELLRGYDLSAIDQNEIIDDIIKTSKQIFQLSHEISRVLSLESGNLSVEFDPIDLMKVAKEVYQRFKIKAKEKQIMLMLDESSKIPIVEADESKIDEVLSNLVSNAIKFTQSGGSVRIKASKIDDTVVFEISDNGPGLTQDDLEKAFKKGSQLSNKPTSGESSTGLGLWIVKKLVEAHKGRVWVRSGSGKGSTFAFSLPINQIF